jgi:hypothetical protein
MQPSVAQNDKQQRNLIIGQGKTAGGNRFLSPLPECPMP